jgi:predicted aldo/keto reductase-like oxidoreductase
MRRFAFDALLVALNAADVHRLSFIRAVLPEAINRGMGVIGMKVCAQGRLLGTGGLTMDEAMGYVLSLPGVSTVVVGCQTPAEVNDNIQIVRQFQPFPEDKMRALEERTRCHSEGFNYYKMPAVKSNTA